MRLFSPGLRRRIRTLPREPLFWILLLAGVLRLAFFLQVRDESLFVVPLWDSAIYDDMARSVARGHGIGWDRAYFFGPLYAYALGLLYLVTGSCASCAIFLQHLLGVVACGLIYALARRWFGRTEGLLAAAMFAVAGVQIFYEGKLLMEALVSTLLAAAVLLMAGAEDGPRRGRLLVGGLLLGLAALGRPTFLLLAPLVLVPVLRSGEPSRRAIVVALASFVAGASTAPAVTLVRNLVVEGVPVLITSSGGFNLFAGNSRESSGMFLDDPRMKADLSWGGEDTAEADVGRDLTSAELSRYWRDRALADIRANPARFVSLVLRKAQILLGAADVPQIEWFTYERERWSVLRLFSLDPRVLMAAAAAGMLALLPRVRKLAFLYGVVVVATAGIALFFVTTRYRVALLPYLCIFAAGFLAFLGRSLQRGEWKTVVPLGLVALAAWGFTSPSRFPVDRTQAVYAQLLHDGFRWLKAGRFAESAAAYRHAGDLWPEDYESHLELGVTLRAAGDLAGSLQALEHAMSRHPGDPAVPYQLGVTLHHLNRFAEAERAQRESLRLSPRRAETHSYLGLTLAAEGRLDEARASLEMSLALDPTQPFALTNLGALLGLQGDETGARRCFLEALRVDGRYAPARLNLAKSYLAAGDAATAARELRRVVADDPKSPEGAEATQLLRTVEP